MISRSLPLAIALLQASAFGQPPAPLPTFDVASLKLTQHGRTPEGHSHSSISSPSPGRLSATNASLAECVRYAYGIKENQLIGPGWLNSDEASYDIEAKAAPETSKAQVRLMLQTLLADRLKLIAHRETRELPMYALVEGKGGAKLQPAKPGRQSGTSSQGGKSTSTNVSMAMFADELARWLKHPVVDRTGIQGNFDIYMEYNSDEGATSSSGELPSLVEAVAKLGLKLEATKGPVEVVVVDRAERVPASN